MRSGAVTGVGELWLSPSWPCSSEPQHQSAPSVVTAHTWSPPMPTDVTLTSFASVGAMTFGLESPVPHQRAALAR